MGELLPLTDSHRYARITPPIPVRPKIIALESFIIRSHGTAAPMNAGQLRDALLCIIPSHTDFAAAHVQPRAGSQLQLDYLKIAMQGHLNGRRQRSYDRQACSLQTSMNTYKRSRKPALNKSSSTAHPDRLVDMVME
jgi:hypothetical protein